MPPVQRPLFLDQDERRIGEEGRIGSSRFQVHERNMEMDRENQESKRNIDRVLRENQLLKDRVDALEFQKVKEDQRFATPNGSDGQRERPFLADRPPYNSKEAETTQEAVRPLEVALSFKA